MQTKELRLALVCYGGVSLAVYMHGVTKEVWKLVRASMRLHRPDATGLPPAGDTERVYQALLGALPGLDLRVMCDIVTGASAGGINGVLLARAIVEGHDLDAIRSLWLDGADSDTLLDRDAASRRLSKLWAIPLVAWVRRRGLAEGDQAEMAGRDDVKRKLSRLMRSRWFQPPFSGVTLSGLLADALAAMANGARTPPLLPRLQPFDLFVTATDYRGAPQRLRLNSPPQVIEPQHRLLIGFSCPGGSDGRHLGDDPSLVFAMRATSSFPGAFPPARASEIEAMLAARGQDWPGRDAFLARILPGRTDRAAVDLIDGAVLDNRPFGPALAALARRPAHREVDRRFVYLDPKPGMHDPGTRPTQAPGFFATILRSLADIPRQQPISDNLAVIAAMSGRARRLRHIVIALMPQVDAAIDTAIGLRLLLLRPTTARLARWRSRMNSEAARAAGFAFGAYARAKLAATVETLATRIAAAGRRDAAAVSQALWRHVQANAIDEPEAVQGRSGADAPFVQFMRLFDLAYRERRLRFVVRRVNMAMETADEATGALLGEAKAGLYAILAPLVARGAPRAGSPALARVCASDDAGAWLAAMARQLDLKSLDDSSDAALVALLGRRLPRQLRRDLMAAYLGFAFFDLAILPLMGDDGVDELDEIKVDRISPEDCTGLVTAGGRQLKGAQFMAFGAFFARAYREHDYLWGRLHGAERLIDIVASSVPGGLPVAQLAAIKQRAFRAILADEQPHLRHIPDTMAALEAALTSAPEAGLADDRPAG